MSLYIKNMVCDRCILAVRQQLDQLDVAYKNIQLGEVELAGHVSKDKMDVLRDNLKSLGFEILDDKKSTAVEKIKNTIIQLVHRANESERNKKLSVLLEENLQMDYNYLSGLFSSIEGITIEKYVILQRIEKAKEFLLYDELSLSEIADKLDYSSVQHLSQQFKKITGLTPSHFRSLKEHKRTPLDKL
jgi:AraC family transcriptional regulator